MRLMTVSISCLVSAAGAASALPPLNPDLNESLGDFDMAGDIYTTYEIQRSGSTVRLRGSFGFAFTTLFEGHRLIQTGGDFPDLTVFTFPEFHLPAGERIHVRDDVGAVAIISLSDMTIDGTIDAQGGDAFEYTGGGSPTGADGGNGHRLTAFSGGRDGYPGLGYFPGLGGVGATGATTERAGSGGGLGGQGGAGGRIDDWETGFPVFWSGTDPTNWDELPGDPIRKIYGGSGGGGAGAIAAFLFVERSGAGGGGGGAIELNAKRHLQINGTVTVRGGDGSSDAKAPGGGGSGGMIRLVGDTVDVDGRVDAGGGSGAYSHIIISNVPFERDTRMGGNGSGGVVLVSERRWSPDRVTQLGDLDVASGIYAIENPDPDVTQWYTPVNWQADDGQLHTVPLGVSVPAGSTLRTSQIGSGGPFTDWQVVSTADSQDLRVTGWFDHLHLEPAGVGRAPTRVIIDGSGGTADYRVTGEGVVRLDRPGAFWSPFQSDSFLGRIEVERGTLTSSGVWSLPFRDADVELGPQGVCTPTYTMYFRSLTGDGTVRFQQAAYDRDARFDAILIDPSEPVDFDFTPKLERWGYVRLYGAGSRIRFVTDNPDFTGGISINRNGELVFDAPGGRVTGDRGLWVISGKVSGTETVPRIIFVSNGTVAPGFPDRAGVIETPGTLEVVSTNARFAFDLFPDGSHDRVEVHPGGAVSMTQPATVSVSAPDGLPDHLTEQRLVSWSGATFDQTFVGEPFVLAGDSPLAGTLSVRSDGVYFTAERPVCDSPANLNGDDRLDFFDVSEFLALYDAGDLAVDFNGDGVLNFFDVSAFLTDFNAGCP